jgi:hypothetical protein
MGLVSLLRSKLTNKKAESTMLKQKQIERNIQFIGDQKNNSILVGNYGDAKITALGNFDLSGLIFCRKSTVEFELAGDGIARFKGICKQLVINRIEGNCTLDLSELSCQIVRCEVVKGRSVVILGKIRTIELISIDEEATVKYEGGPLIIKNHSISPAPAIENLRSVA